MCFISKSPERSNIAFTCDHEQCTLFEEKEKVATLVKKDHDTGDDYYTESRRLLERENVVLMCRNLEFFEEIEATKIRNIELENNLHLLQQQPFWLPEWFAMKGPGRTSWNGLGGVARNLILSLRVVSRFW
ncbi:36732_t:CDS:2 [Gigaspora margarita]|uniref:36732_t:CDS:1 n=1 Tax=Gigaspora margarita TaxID=4874 RepID=A0ABN7WJ99_GIGMA|nr:36732_t:CDS:2 [Gigaspora margarita]